MNHNNESSNSAEPALPRTCGTLFDIMWHREQEFIKKIDDMIAKALIEPMKNLTEDFEKTKEEFQKSHDFYRNAHDECQKIIDDVTQCIDSTRQAIESSNVLLARSYVSLGITPKSQPIYFTPIQVYEEKENECVALKKEVATLILEQKTTDKKYRHLEQENKELKLENASLIQQIKALWVIIIGFLSQQFKSAKNNLYSFFGSPQRDEMQEAHFSPPKTTRKNP